MGAHSHKEPASMDIVVVAGMSGAGKTVAIKALEDCGYYSADHLPADTLPTVLASLARKGVDKVAIGLDVWDPHFLEGGPDAWLLPFEGRGSPKLMLLEASDESLARRFGETRRRHPLSAGGLSLADAIAQERAILARHAGLGHKVDTSDMSPNTLKAYVKDFLGLRNSHMDIRLESFGFKHGAPSTCDLMFDARCLPNPHYDPALRHLTGQDQPVQEFFARGEKPAQMAQQIADFVSSWRSDYERDHRSYLTVAIGCTGGQHRSVFVAELAAKILRERGVEARCNHREQARWPAQSKRAAPKP